ncbi:hypothetical protein N7491_003943 [Penicillium cf. griseofulvum]|uniref:DUF4246 domain-containing protein n=1 Tax=Penicillium cf. griseofulvum TaxID=2972120 RepID=A0A9W9T172_9EURO|nr:hypothetical protein N7472_001879 [Penicillium cf. griseofulvum]KAJ5441537.1 hypothetical protein N7491_003943 [Penicillium cf. griseofulvum]
MLEIATEAFFGFGDDVQGNEYDDDITRNLGAVSCKEGRLLAFPSTVHIRVSSFRLADPSKPGHHKILALLLIDLHHRIISSASVPPQRENLGYKRQNSVNQAL